MEHTASLKQQCQDNDKQSEFQSRLQKVENEMAKLQAIVHEYEMKKLKTEQQSNHKMFKKIGSKFYYFEENELLNWYAAANKCTELGAHLASIQNQEEFDAIATMLNRYKWYWIDVNDLSQEGEFRSLTTGRLAQFLNWYPGHNPNNMGGIEHCAHLWTRNDNIIGMNDENCSKKMAFICELFEN